MDHHHRRNGNVVTNGSYHQANKPETAVEATNNKKKTRKWSLGGLFKRRRAKSSDTDSSTEFEDKKKSFLALRSPIRNKSASHKVVGKFDAIIIPRNEPPPPPLPPPQKMTNGYATLNSIENYDASPLVIKRELPFRNSQELVAKGSNGSIDNTSRRNGKQRIKAKVEAMRDRLGESSSSDEYGGSSKTSNSSSLQRQNGELREGGSLSRKSRAARTDRYIRRHFRENNVAALPSAGSDPRLTAANGHKVTPVGSPQNRWVARVVYQQSHDYPTPYDARSATSSPLNSPLSRSKDYLQCSSLPGKRSSALLYEPRDMFDDEIAARYPRSCEYLPKDAPPPPPRNPYRKIVPMDKCVEGRPSSYAFDANARSTDIVAYINQSRPYGYRSPPDRVHRLQRKSSSDAALQRSDRPAATQSYAPAKYCADKSPRSRNPIQLVQKVESDAVSEPMLVSENGFHDARSSLKKANEIGIPVAQPPPVTYAASVINKVSRKTYPERGVRGRPLSVVSEKSDSEFLQPNGERGKLSASELRCANNSSKQNPRNLEEALVELEEIYNSLRLSDEDLLDRAERRDLQSALRMNPNFSRHSWQDLEEDEDGDENGTNAESRKVFSVECLCSPRERNAFSPRLPTGRRSTRPDRVADDMAYRKLNKRGSGDPISNPNLVSQSGSFLLVSPALSPPPLVDVQPIIAQIDKEPDITLDDVVFRNIRHTNNTLKVADPQPPFGIPLGPVSPAPNSDYLHATPSEKYRSTFNPMRTPDVVKDDLAFRNLRKDVRTDPAAAQHFIVPCGNDSRKRRAIRSLSANIVSMVGKDTSSYSSENEESSIVDVNCNNLSKSNRCASFNDLPDILEDYRRRRRTLIKNCDECLDHKEEVAPAPVPAPAPSSNGRSITQIADEARMLSNELRQKLRELDAIPPTTSVDDEKCEQPGPALQSQSFRKRVALHKPITLSQFRIDDRSGEGAHARHDDDDVAHDEVDDTLQMSVANGRDSCANFNEEYEQGECATTYECGSFGDDNSSSGVSSTSNSPMDSFDRDDLNSVVSDFYLGAEAAYGTPSLDSAADSSLSTTCSRDDTKSAAALPEEAVRSKTLPNAKCSRNAATASAELNDGRKCSRIEITLSPPQPSESFGARRRWSAIETKDVAIMTEELSIPASNEKGAPAKRMSDNTSQARVSRYKEERRKQLANQFANLLRHHDTTTSSSSTSTSETNFRKTTVRVGNSNGNKIEEDGRKSKIPYNRSWNRTRCKEDFHPDVPESKKIINGVGSVTTSDLTSTNSSKNNNRDKSARRKSFLNRSINAERTTTNNCGNRNQQNHSNFSPDGTNGAIPSRDTRKVTTSSLPVRVAVGSTTASTLSSSSSHKQCPSRSIKVKSSSIRGTSRDSPVSSSSESARNGFAHRQQRSSSVSTDQCGSISSRIRTSERTSGNQSRVDDCSVAPHEKLPNADCLDEPCDNTSSDFRLRDIDSPPLSSQQYFEDGELPFVNSERKSDATKKLSTLSSSPAPSSVDATKCKTNGFSTADQHQRQTVTKANVEDLFTHKNSLLEIIQTFSGKCPPGNGTTDTENTVTAAVAENGVNESASHSNGGAETISSPTSYARAPSPQNLSLDIIEEDLSLMKPSILKKKFNERSSSVDSPKPNSILKRKTVDEKSSGADANGSGGGGGGGARLYSKTGRQGILKKYSSLDEEEVARRSCSPDTMSDLRAACLEFKPILKIQRPSSLEEIERFRPPELHSILKRSKQPQDEISDSGSASSPHHGILKRKISVTNDSYDGRSLDSDTVSDTESAVKPILKNKQYSLEMALPGEHVVVETPKPILKKKFCDVDQCEEEKPKKPILKSSSRKSLDENRIPSNRARSVEWQTTLDEERNIKPILKKRDGCYRVMDSRNVKSDDDTANSGYRNSERIKRNSLPGFGNINRRSSSPPSDGAREWCTRRREVTEFRGWNLEERRIEFTASVEHEDRLASTTQNCTFENGQHDESSYGNAQERMAVATATSTSINNGSCYREVACTMESNSSDAASSKSEGRVNAEKDSSTDETAMMSSLRRSNSVSAKASLFQQLARESKKACDEGLLKTRTTEPNANRRKLKVKCADLNSRFATQPVTCDEVAEAKKQNNEARTARKIVDIRNEILEIAAENDAVTNGYSYLPISERVKLLTSKFEGNDSSSSTRRSVASSRFITQPVTEHEIRVARIGIHQQEAESETKSSTPKTSSSVSHTRREKLTPFKAALAAKKTLHEKTSDPSSQSEGDTSSSGSREVQSIIGAKRHSSSMNQEPKNRSAEMNSVMSGGTDVVDECPVINGNKSIKQRLAALQQSGQLDWKKRVAKKEVSSPIIKINETQELLKKELQNGFRNKMTGDVRADEKNDSGLAERLEKLETASQTWKKRVEPSDAVQFSVAGKIASTLPSTPTTPKTLISSPLSERKKRGPCPSRFRSKNSFREQKKENESEPDLLETSKSNVTINRSNSSPIDDATNDGNAKRSETNTVVTVPQIYDDNFSTFFGHVESVPAAEESSAVDADFSFIKSEGPRLVPIHKKAKVQRKHATTGNPLKNMATRIEIKNEYREVKADVLVEREKKRVNVEKFSKNSSLAVEALAGLASKEDFAAVQLKKAVPLSSPMLPYKPLMLLHIKGRRHVQTRLVEPVVHSVNSGDSYVLVTPNEVYHYIGQYSNVIERSRGTEIAQHIASAHDLGYTGAGQAITIAEDSTKTNPKSVQKFWILLGATAEQASSLKAIPTGHPDEDEVYESSLLSTNMVYEVHEDELVPIDKYWASIPKIQMLDPNKVLVFDFGTELYVWMGKNVDIKLRKSSVKLAKELWENGFNYEECDLCPIHSAASIGDRGESVTPLVVEKRSSQRPDWCLFAKVTQHMETVLFREKFLDWPDFSRVIRTKEQEENSVKQTDCNFNVSPLNAKEMMAAKMSEPDLVLEGSHLGRGIQYFDEERRLFYKVTTVEVKMWHVAEFEREEVAEQSMGQFYSTDSYVIKWVYSISYSGRELSGQPSKHTTMGRDRCVFFYWQGKNASLNEQGAAALLTVELDEEKGIQLRICQGYEPPAFFNLFTGRSIVYRTKRSAADKNWRLFICRGEVATEASLLEVACNIRQLRSRASFVMINVNTGITFVWHGCKVTRAASKICQTAVNKMTERPPPELGLASDVILSVTEINEGSEPKEFFTGLGSSNRKLYVSLLHDKEVYDSTPLLFHLATNNGVFSATPVWAPGRSTSAVTAYPFLQEDLYSANQPALFVLDSGKEIWMWQGWWPERENTDGELSPDEEVPQNGDKDRGSASIRWQAERRAAMQTVLDCWKLKHGDKPIKANLVWAGLEPIQFTNMFPDWKDRDDVAEMNILDGRKSAEVLDVEQELERLTQSTYPIEQLLQRPLPDGVDPTKLELYLSSSHFKDILKMTKEEFAALPNWKQTNLKKNAGLF